MKILDRKSAINRRQDEGLDYCRDGDLSRLLPDGDLSRLLPDGDLSRLLP
jgi:hypothetical protein